jgi:hypothetical protein
MRPENKRMALDDHSVPAEHLDEYYAAVTHYARTGHLPDCMGSPGAIDWIQLDPETFADAVKLERYAITMGKHE